MTATSIDASQGANLLSEEKPTTWSGVFAMSVCAFALIASEFLPVSLLTPMATDLHVTEGMAGQGIAISGAFAVFTSLFISALAGSLDRKTLLLGLTGAMGLSGAIVALAPNYATYMLGRALIGVVVGGFWSLSAATAIRLVPPRDVPRALAIVNGGNALATVVAAPLGAYLGTVVGWRGAFLCLVPVSLIALAWQWKTLPAMPAAARPPGIGNVFKVFTLFKHPGVAVGMLASSLLFMGQFGLFTYVRPFLETVTGVHGTSISLVLLVIGTAGFVGTVLIGHVLQRGFYLTLVVIPVLMAVTAPGADRLRRLGRHRRRAAGAVGPDRHLGTRGLVGLDRQGVSEGCRGRRRPVRRRGAAVHRAGLHRGRPAVRPQRLPEYLRHERGTAGGLRGTDGHDRTRRGAAESLTAPADNRPQQRSRCMPFSVDDLARVGDALRAAGQVELRIRVNRRLAALRTSTGWRPPDRCTPSSTTS